MTNNIQRRFILGDEWVYFKIYSGPKTLEKILSDEITNLVNELFENEIIDQFFFIRYADPEYHLRIRFHLPKTSGLNKVIERLNSRLRYYLDNRLVWKMSADTYSREIERYGRLTMLPAESLFCLDSLAIINFLKETDEKGNDQMRWLWGIKCVDLLLTEFGLSLNDKIELYKMLNAGYSQEFQMNKPMQIQLDKKYRVEMKQIRNIIEQPEISNLPGLSHISSYMKYAEPIIRQIIDVSSCGELGMPLNNFLGSLLHMHFNRLFRTKQRMHELVIYYFMHKFYISQAARLKYSKKSKVSQ